MGVSYITATILTIALLVINLVWLGINISLWISNGIQYMLQGMNFVERIHYSIYLKWILLADLLWFAGVLIFLASRKYYKTDPNLHYLQHNPIDGPKICVVIPAYNEEEAIEQVVRDFLIQRYVKHVIVIDNHSSDKTAVIAEMSGAKVVVNHKNMGLAYSCTIGLAEALKTDSNIICLTEGDGTCSGHDIEKMIPYLDNCDLVVGTRQLQVLSEKENQNSMTYVWANYYLAKLIQLKFFSLLHRGVVSFTDVGCIFRLIRREAMEKIIDEFFNQRGNVIPGLDFTVFMSIVAIQNELKIVEVPITFKRRIGESKTRSDRRLKALEIGFRYIWCILSR